MNTVVSIPAVGMFRGMVMIETVEDLTAQVVKTEVENTICTQYMQDGTVRFVGVDTNGCQMVLRGLTDDEVGTATFEKAHAVLEAQKAERYARMKAKLEAARAARA